MSCRKHIICKCFEKWNKVKGWYTNKHSFQRPRDYQIFISRFTFIIKVIHNNIVNFFKVILINAIQVLYWKTITCRWQRYRFEYNIITLMGRKIIHVFQEPVISLFAYFDTANPTGTTRQIWKSKFTWSRN